MAYTIKTNHIFLAKLPLTIEDIYSEVKWLGVSDQEIDLVYGESNNPADYMLDYQECLVSVDDHWLDVLPLRIRPDMYVVSPNEILIGDIEGTRYEPRDFDTNPCTGVTPWI